jgi:hypothetical protein
MTSGTLSSAAKRKPAMPIGPVVWTWMRSGLNGSVVRSGRPIRTSRNGTGIDRTRPSRGDRGGATESDDGDGDGEQDAASCVENGSDDSDDAEGAEERTRPGNGAKIEVGDEEGGGGGGDVAEGEDAGGGDVGEGEDDEAEEEGNRRERDGPEKSGPGRMWMTSWPASLRSATVNAAERETPSGRPSWLSQKWAILMPTPFSCWGGDPHAGAAILMLGP